MLKYFFLLRWNNNYKRLPTLEPEVNQKINLELDTNNFCPYKTWRHYFPFEDYNAQSATANTINVNLFIFCKVLYLTV